MKIRFVLVVLIFSTSVYAQTGLVESICQTSAYIIDKDPKGLNVRKKPSGKSSVFGKIPFDKDGTMVTIIASAGKWVKIKEAWNMEEKTVFSKQGWVYAPLLAISIANPTGERKLINIYESPSIDNAIIVKLPPFKEYKLAGCFESWIKVTIPQKKQSISGWVKEENQCDLAQTNC